MRKTTYLIFLIILAQFANASCIPQVNKSKPKGGVAGGQFNHCDVDNSLNTFCDPTSGTENYMTRHHIFDKYLWIDTLDKGLNQATKNQGSAEKNVIKLLQEAGASTTVVEDFKQDGKTCNSETNKWLTWLPVNLSLGPAPQDRSFDPGNDFDNWALLIVSDKTAQTTFENIHTAVINYDNNAIAEGLAQLPAVKIPWQMTLGADSNWIRAYDSKNQQKYCPKEIFDSYAMNICPNEDVKVFDMSEFYQLIA
ncbi:hypothetical protein FLM55_04855 [Francisella sp. Scap27]|uniref:hypothetical protein n=1 Tax=Francisella sp. Scap27 TaxID=2589986 RepID=UPI0015C000EE|nr:hypothetical protein [Francisella sp. Scap27]QLE79100.1 hypothetical protein FLM55_04855 [Francisella sp. Scap27]